MAWTDERIALLKKRWNEGDSFSEIAAELGDVSRNACIGKIHRLGMGETPTYAVRREPKRVAPPEKKTPRPKRTQMKRKRPKWNPEAAELESTAQPYVESTPMSDLEIPLEQRKTLMELTSGDCRWPVGDPCTADFFFCGADRNGSLPYCVGHCLRAFNGAPQRTRSEAAIEQQRRAMLRRFGKTEGSSKILDGAV